VCFALYPPFPRLLIDGQENFHLVVKIVGKSPLDEDGHLALFTRSIADIFLLHRVFLLGTMYQKDNQEDKEVKREEAGARWKTACST